MTSTPSRTIRAIPSQVQFLFNHLTLGIIEKGFRHYSAYAIMHQMRWHYDTAVASPDDKYKISNGWGPTLARAFHTLYPSHSEFFHIRGAPVSHPEVADEVADEVDGDYDTISRWDDDYDVVPGKGEAV